MSDNRLNTNEYLSNCDPKDVISFKSEKWSSVGKLKDIIWRAFRSDGVHSMSHHIAHHSDFKHTESTNSWFFQGQECEILRAGSKGWKKGKIKINVTLEFIPDEIETNKSPLDDIRQADANNAPQQ